MVQRGRVFVVEGALAIELVVEPLAFVGFDVGLVVEGALAVHLVGSPLALVVPAVLVVEFAMALAHPV